MLRLLGAVVLAAVLTGAPQAADAVDLNGKWRVETLGAFIPPQIIQITQTGSAITIPFVFTFTGTVGATDPDGYTPYSTSFSSGSALGELGGRITPSGNLLDGLIAVFVPPGPADIGAIIATRCTCDDGNSSDGDGCDATCQVEPCWTCVGDPSVCTPTGDGGACEDGSVCTTGETCTAAVCGGGTPVVPCFDMSGPWTRHLAIPALGLVTDTMATAIQRGSDLRLGDHVGTINPATGAFDVRVADPIQFCGGFDPLVGALAPDGLTYSATGTILEPRPLTPDQCDQLNSTEIGDHCGNGTFDGVEECDDGNLINGDGCSAQCIVEACSMCSGSPSVCGPAAGDPCDDGNPCTASDTCAGDGSCAGTPAVGDPCDDGSPCTTDDACTVAGTCSGSTVTCEPCFACDLALGCVAQPQPACKSSTAPTKSILSLTNNADDTKDRLSWRWSKGSDTLLSELGDPSAGDDVTFCLYDESLGTPSLLFRATIPGGSLWRATAAGFRYKEVDAAADGVLGALLKSGSGAKASAKVEGRGVHLSDRPYGLPAPPLPMALRVQLRGEGGMCLETRHDATSIFRNDAAKGLFKARGVP